MYAVGMLQNAPKQTHETYDHVITAGT